MLLYLLAGGGAIVSALLASAGNSYVWWWLSVALLLPLMTRIKHCFSINPFTLSVLGFFLWLTINQVFFDSAIYVQQLYFVPQGLIAFLIFAGIPATGGVRLAKIALAIGAVVTVWGLAQHYFGLGIVHSLQGWRAHTTFASANSLATFLNLLLLPLVALYLLRGERALSIVLLLVLLLGVLATQSKGGILTTVGSLMLLLIVHRTSGRTLRLRRVVTLLLIVVVAITVELVPKPSLPDLPNSATLSLSDRASQLIEYGEPKRFEHYRIAWHMIGDKWFLGHGLLNYRYVLNRERSELFGRESTMFVHNDYLQFWAETGLPGVVLFVAILAALGRAVYVRRNQMRPVRRDLLYACALGVSTAYLHAAVDFPFFVPANLLVIGALLGLCARLLADGKIDNERSVRAAEQLQAIGIRPRWLLGLITYSLAVVLAFPWFAQEALRLAGRAAVRGDSALVLHSLQFARAFAPYESSYHWVEGEVWRESARVLKRSDLARRADQLYASGAAANPYDTQSTYFRLQLNLFDRGLLDAPADSATLLKWSRHLIDSDPGNRYYHVTHINVLRLLGRSGEGESALGALQAKFPSTKFAESSNGMIYIQK